MAKKKPAKRRDPVSDAIPTRKEIDIVFNLASDLNVIADHYWSQLSQPQPQEQIESITKDLSKRVIELTHALTPTLENLIRDPVTLVEMGGRCFRTAHAAAIEFGCSVLRYRYGGGDPITNHLPKHSEWSVDRLGKLIEVERNRGVDWLEKGWSIPRSPTDWIKVFERLNVKCRSIDAFDDQRKAGVFRQHPDSTTKLVKLALDCLPPTYSDQLVV